MQKINPKINKIKRLDSIFDHKYPNSRKDYNHRARFFLRNYKKNQIKPRSLNLNDNNISRGG